MKTFLKSAQNQSFSSKICSGSSHEIDKLAILYQSYFSKSGLENSREIPAKSAIFSAYLPLKILRKSRDLPEALWNELHYSIWRIFLSCFQNLMAFRYIFSFKIQLAEMSKRKQIQSLLNTFFRGKQERESNTTPTTPAAAPIKKTRKFQELWEERLNFRIPGHLICIFQMLLLQSHSRHN